MVPHDFFFLAYNEKVLVDILLFTSEEPLYLPQYLEPIFETHHDVISQVFLAQPTDTRRSQLSAQFRMFGPGDFVRVSSQFAWGKLLAQLPSTWQEQLTGRYHAVASLASAFDTPVKRVRDVTDPDFVEEVRKSDPDLILSIVCGQRLNADLLSIPEWAINVHGSLLPRYRGRATAFWPLYYGDDQSGVTAHLMTEEFDAGPILSQRSFDIAPSDTMLDVYRKIARTGADLTVDLLGEFPDPSFNARANQTTPADYHSLPTAEQRREFQRRGNELI